VQQTVQATDDEAPKFVDIDRQSLGLAALTGLAVGILTWFVSWFFQHVIFNPLVCHSSVVTCADNGVIAFNIASILVAIAGVVALVRGGIYRPVLVALAALVSLWSLQGLLNSLGWFEALLWTAALYALAYGLFAWILKIYNLTIAAILLVILVVLARIAIAA
jgi:hypothetical protein